MAIFVRCIDNTLAADVLVVGEIYEVMHINERDGLYALSGLGRFTMTRFELVSAAEASDWPSRLRRSPAPSLSEEAELMGVALVMRKCSASK